MPSHTIDPYFVRPEARRMGTGVNERRTSVAISSVDAP
jgi:hypothetical protein